MPISVTEQSMRAFERKQILIILNLLDIDKIKPCLTILSFKSKCPLKFPKDLKEKLDEETKRKSRSRNFIVNLALKTFLDKPEKDRYTFYP